jgi:hypothetical protein
VIEADIRDEWPLLDISEDWLSGGNWRLPAGQLTRDGTNLRAITGGLKLPGGSRPILGL